MLMLRSLSVGLYIVNVKTKMIFMSVAVWRVYLFSRGWSATNRKGTDKPRGCISKLTMTGGAYHKPRGDGTFLFFFKSQITLL